MAIHRLDRLPERPSIVVVDNSHEDGSAELVLRRQPQVRLIRPGRNLEAVGRNAPVTGAFSQVLVNRYRT